VTGWLELEDAQARLLALAPQMGSEEVPVSEALGRVLAKACIARRTQPPADLSAMDGYAVRGTGPWSVVGESRGGAPFEGSLADGEAVRISTGAEMPDGGEAVLIQEDAQREGERLEAVEMPPPGRHVRRRGFDFAQGDTVLEAGRTIGPGQIALALAAGHGALKVARRPRVAVIDSGDELAANPEHCAPGQIPASNGAMVAAMLEPLVGPCERNGPVRDDLDALAGALESVEDCDIVVTSGGASVGDHDLVQEALVRWGAEIAFWKVAIRPGKPLLVATRESGGHRQVILGLPGNPVSSFVTAYLFALPLLRKAMGAAAPLPAASEAIAAEALPQVGPRREFVRGIVEGGRVRRAGSQDSSALHSLARANCLIERAAGSSAIPVGEPVRVHYLRNG
jgi:molybdopterin molybdotransferase